MLLVIKPLAFVVGAVRVGVSAHAFGLVVDPLSFIDISVGVHKLSVSVGFVVSPLAFVATAIWPELGADAVTHAIKPLTSVSGSVTQGVGTFRNSSEFINLFISRWTHIRSSLSKNTALTAIVAVIAYRKVSDHLICLLTIFVLEIVVHVILHVLFVKRLSDLTIFVFTLPIAVAGAISHFWKSSVFLN